MGICTYFIYCERIYTAHIVPSVSHSKTDAQII